MSRTRPSAFRSDGSTTVLPSICAAVVGSRSVVAARLEVAGNAAACIGILGLVTVLVLETRGPVAYAIGASKLVVVAVLEARAPVDSATGASKPVADAVLETRGPAECSTVARELSMLLTSKLVPS